MTNSEFLDIEDRAVDYQEVYSETMRAEKGVRAIALMYHDHSNDQNSKENVFRLKTNIEYRLFSATHQYLVLLRELESAETTLKEKFNENPKFMDIRTGNMTNPYFDKIETQLSSIFDSIIFHISSVFDYLSHSICYMYFDNKQKTLYWTKLSKKVRGDFKGKYKFCEKLDQIDRKFVGKLYDYRSRLLHNKRDKHFFDGLVELNGGDFKLKINCSDESLKKFQLVNEDKLDSGQKITLTYLASWLLKKTFSEMESLFDSVKEDLESNSHFHTNITNPKGGKNSFNIISINPETKFAEPVSQGIWNEYKKEKGSS